MLPPTLPTTRRIKRFSPLQLGKMLGFLYGLMGLVFLPFLLIAMFVSSQVPGAQQAGFMALGLGFTLFIPVMYAVMGFVSGVFGAWIYNLVAKWIGGIEVEIE